MFSRLADVYTPKLLNLYKIFSLKTLPCSRLRSKPKIGRGSSSGYKMMIPLLNQSIDVINYYG